MALFCGNNRNNANGRRLGTKYECLRKGIFVGYNMPVDPDYLTPYDPIDTRKIYCGKKRRLPNNYDYLGNAPLCLSRGVGLGKKQKAEEGDESDEDDAGDGIETKNIKLHCFLILFSIIAVFMLIYYIKPSFVMKIDKNKRKKINWYKFAFLYFLILIPIFVLIFKIMQKKN